MTLLKKIFSDFLGILLIISAILFGWLPGPGGVPLFLAGLSLLAANHEWARRLLEYIKTKGLKLADSFFKDHPVLIALYDTLAVLLIALAIFIFATYTKSLLHAASIVMFFVGLGLFLGNKKRLKRLTAKVKRQTKA